MLNTCIIRVANKKLVKYVNYFGLLSFPSIAYRRIIKSIIIFTSKFIHMFKI